MQVLSAEQLVGKSLGAYQIERLLGHNQLGAAYIARQRTEGSPVIISAFHLPEDLTAQERTSLAQEGETLLRLTHPHLLPIYDFIERPGSGRPGSVYLVTAFASTPSLGQVWKQQGRLTLQQTLPVLKQLALGLDYAHGQGIVHGMLSLSNVIVRHDQTIQIAGFGMKTILEIQRQRRKTGPQTHLVSPDGTFLGNPDFISPECVQGMPASVHSDQYALGIMLFALLSGTLPFRGADALDLTLARLRQPAPSLHTICPAVPKAYDLVLGKMLAGDPAKRYSSASESASAFERVYALQHATQGDHASDPASPFLVRTREPEVQLTLPPTVNWFDEHLPSVDKWQVVPSESSGRIQSTAMATSPVALEQTQPDALRDKHPAFSLGGIDPFVWWSAISSGSTGAPPQPAGTPSSSRVSRVSKKTRPQHASHRPPAQKDRRKLVAFMATGAVTAGVLTVGGLSFAHLVQSMKRSQTALSTANAPTGMTPAPGSTPAATVPTPKPSMATHTGTVIGSTALAVNSAKAFTNPIDGKSSLLLHLANGTFLAAERACRHQRVPVNYDPARKLLVCPLHGATYDPLHGFAHVSGPGAGPLPTVPIHTQNDGTITAG